MPIKLQRNYGSSLHTCTKLYYFPPAVLFHSSHAISIQ